MVNPIAPIRDIISTATTLNKEVRDILNTKLAFASQERDALAEKVVVLTRENADLAAENASLKADKEQLQQELRDALLPRGPVSPSISAPRPRKPRSLDGW